MSARPFRFGIVAARAQSGVAWAESTRRLESVGVDVLLMPDRLESILAAIPALAMAAAATQSLRLGTYVLADGRHNAAQIAHDSATLDFLSGGRFELGLGTGVSQADFVRAGLPFASPGQRIEHLAATIGAVRGFWEEFGAGGPQHYPAPAQRPGPPILVGGGGKRLLTVAAQEADIVSIGLSRGDFSAESLAGRIGWIRAAAGERLDAIELSINLAVVIGEGEVAPHVRGRLRQFMQADVDELIEACSPFVLAGSTAGMAEQLLALREETGISYIMTADDQLGTFGPIIAQLAGK